jgi:hypothetical protein
MHSDGRSGWDPGIAVIVSELLRKATSGDFEVLQAIHGAVSVAVASLNIAARSVGRYPIARPFNSN